MKKFSRIEPTLIQPVGLHYKRSVIVKNFQTDDGALHEFTTWLKEDARSGGVVAVTADNQVITTYQFRAGPERWLYEIPGGGLEPTEDPQIGALRELREETGYIPAAVEYLGQGYRDAYTNGESHYFLATGCTLSDNGSELDHEEILQGANVHLMSIADFIENARSGLMTDPSAVLMAYEKLKALQKA